MQFSTSSIANNVDPRLANSQFVQLKNKIHQQHKQNMAEIRANHSVEEIKEQGLHLKSKEAARMKIAPDINWNNLEDCPKNNAILEEFRAIRSQIAEEFCSQLPDSGSIAAQKSAVINSEVLTIDDVISKIKSLGVKTVKIESTDNNLTIGQMKAYDEFIRNNPRSIIIPPDVLERMTHNYEYRNRLLFAIEYTFSKDSTMGHSYGMVFFYISDTSFGWIPIGDRPWMPGDEDIDDAEDNHYPAAQKEQDYILRLSKKFAEMFAESAKLTAMENEKYLFEKTANAYDEMGIYE